MSLTAALKKLERAVSQARGKRTHSRSKNRKSRKPAKRLTAPSLPPRDDRAADALVQRTRAELPGVFDSTPFDPLALRDATRAAPVVRPTRRDRLAELAWAGQGHDYSQATTPAEPGTKGVPLRRRGKSAHRGDDTTTGLER